MSANPLHIQPLTVEEHLLTLAAIISEGFVRHLHSLIFLRPESNQPLEQIISDIARRTNDAPVGAVERVNRLTQSIKLESEVQA